MKDRLNRTNLGRIAIILSVSIIATPGVFVRQVAAAGNPEAAQSDQYQAKLQQVMNDKAGYAANIVHRWESSAKASGHWDENYATDLFGALMKLQPENLLAAGEASSYEAMMAVLAGGPKNQAAGVPALGEIGSDLVYTPVTPCRIVDTRNAGGPIAAGTTRSFDVDSSDFSSQGGFAGSCGIPFGVARAVVMTITETGSVNGGYFTAWAFGGAQPLSSILNYYPNRDIANTTVVPVTPSSGVDFSLYSLDTAHAVVDVAGYFAAPVATALDCITLTSAVTTVAFNSWMAVDADCPSDRTATGGGFQVPEGTLGRPNVWVDTIPNGNGWRSWVDNQTGGNRNVQTFVRCCRIPGR